MGIAGGEFVWKKWLRGGAASAVVAAATLMAQVLHAQVVPPTTPKPPATPPTTPADPTLPKPSDPPKTTDSPKTTDKPSTTEDDAPLAPGQVKVDAKLLLGAAVAKVGPEYADVDKAIDMFGNNDSLGALNLLKEVKKKIPTLPPPELLLAKLYGMTNQADRWRAALELAVINYPDDPEPYLIFGDQAYGQNRTTDSDLLFAKALELASKVQSTAERKQDLTFRAYAGLAAIAERRAKRDSAIAHLQKWIEIDPKSSAAYRRMGQAKFMQEKYKDAYLDLQKSKELDDNQPLADIVMAILYEQQGKRDDAKKFIDRAVQAGGNDTKTLLAVCEWLLATQQFPQAKTQLEAVLKLDARSVPGLIYSGVVARLMGEKDEALKFFQAAHLREPRNFDAANQIAVLLAEQSNVAEQNLAITYAEQNAKENNTNPEAGATLAWVYYQAGRNKEALQLMDNIIKSRTSLSPDGQYYLAKMLYDQQKGPTAKQVLDVAIASKQIFMHRKEAQDLARKIGDNK